MSFGIEVSIDVTWAEIQGSSKSHPKEQPTEESHVLMDARGPSSRQFTLDWHLAQLPYQKHRPAVEEDS